MEGVDEFSMADVGSKLSFVDFELSDDGDLSDDPLDIIGLC